MLVMAATRWRRAARGFTLIELIVVVALLAIVSSIAAPGLRSFASGQRVKALSFDLTADLLFARSEALKRGVSVTMTPTTGTDWNQGWKVSSGGTDLSTRQASNESLVFTGAPSSITFNAWGRVSSPTSAVRMTVKSSVTSNTSATRCIQLDPSGRASAKVGACA
jgi:prepilin-type N-terminal cleavage/methylation domain-containing protein